MLLQCFIALPRGTVPRDKLLFALHFSSVVSRFNRSNTIVNVGYWIGMSALTVFAFPNASSNWTAIFKDLKHVSEVGLMQYFKHASLTSPDTSQDTQH